MKTINKIFFRSFLLQALWNYEKMQSAGFLFALLPQLKKLYLDKDDFWKGVRRYSGFFNTHPYMVSLILGYAAKEEKNIKNGSLKKIAELDKFRIQMSGPLAAIGDKIFWSTWRPLVGLVAVLLAFLPLQPLFLIPLIFIVLYNIPVLYFRYYALRTIYKGETEIISIVKKINNSLILKIIPILGLIIVGVILKILFFHWGSMRGGLLLSFTAIVVILRTCCQISAIKLLYIISAMVIIGSLIIG